MIELDLGLRQNDDWKLFDFIWILLITGYWTLVTIFSGSVANLIFWFFLCEGLPLGMPTLPLARSRVCGMQARAVTLN